MTDTARATNSEHTLYAFIERIERLTEEKQALADDIREVFSAVKGSGFDTAVVRKLIARRRKPRDTIEEADALLDTYEAAIRRTEAAQQKRPVEASNASC